MMKKLIKLNKSHFIIVDESLQVTQGKVVIDIHGTIYTQETDKIFEIFTGSRVVTHSTNVEDGVEKINLLETINVVENTKTFSLQDIRSAIEFGWDIRGEKSYINDNYGSPFIDYEGNTFEEIEYTEKLQPIGTEWNIEFIDGKISII
jgi:hypothetical protein